MNWIQWKWAVKQTLERNTNLLRRLFWWCEIFSGKSSGFSSRPRWKGNAISQDRDQSRRQRTRRQNRETRTGSALRRRGSRMGDSREVRSWGSRRSSRRGSTWSTWTRTTCSSPLRISCCSQVLWPTMYCCKLADELGWLQRNPNAQIEVTCFLWYFPIADISIPNQPDSSPPIHFEVWVFKSIL